jgi:hypothetical protein
MRKLLSILAIVSMSLILSSSLHASSSITDEETIHVFAHRARLKLVDVNGRGLTPGDILVGRTPLFNRAETRRIGRSLIHCVFVDVEHDPHCVSDNVLPGGTVTVEGILTQPRFVFAVTGGTGRYNNVRGELEGMVRSGNRGELIFRLIP